LHHSTFPDLSARDLLAVQVLSECKSFMAASLTLNVSQPALTRTIQRIEETVGLELFRRSTRRVEITAAGSEFAAVAGRILSDLRISLANMRDVEGEQRGQLIVACVMSIAYMRLPDMVQQYRERRPRVEIHVREGVHGDVVDDVRSGVADLGITYVDDVPSGCEAISLGREAFHVVVPQGHLLAEQGKPLTLAKAAAYPMVSLPKDAQTRRMLDELASGAGIALQHAVTVNQFATIMQCVRAGVGIAIVPGGAIASAVATGLVSRPLSSPAVTRQVGLLMLSHRTQAPGAKEFVSHVRASWRASPKRKV
jgi:DNA-binding transcriptional LysR family regulator